MISKWWYYFNSYLHKIDASQYKFHLFIRQYNEKFIHVLKLVDDSHNLHVKLHPVTNNLLHNLLLCRWSLLFLPLNISMSIRAILQRSILTVWGDQFGKLGSSNLKATCTLMIAGAYLCNKIYPPNMLGCCSHFSIRGSEFLRF